MKLGQYEVLGELGRGGMGVVLEARAPDGGLVAIKVMSSRSPRAGLRFDRERRLLAKLSSSRGFVPLLDEGEAREGPFFVMPRLTGGTLRVRLANGSLGIAETVALGSTLAKALGSAHKLGIVHRDMKPENVLYTGDGEPLIADLGLAKHFAGTSSKSVALTRVGQLCGTTSYMAPEQVRDASSVDARTDVFALGLIIHECLSGRPTFEGEDVMSVLAKVDACAPRPIEELRRDTPPLLAAVVARSLARDPDARFAHGDALARALKSVTASGSAKRSRKKTTSSDSRAPGSVRSLLDRAYTRRVGGELPGAIRDLERALTLEPDGPYASKIRAKITKLTRNR